MLNYDGMRSQRPTKRDLDNVSMIANAMERIARIHIDQGVGENDVGFIHALVEGMTKPQFNAMMAYCLVSCSEEVLKAVKKHTEIN